MLKTLTANIRKKTRKYKQTSSLVEALLCNFNVGFEHLLGTYKAPSLSLPVLLIYISVHPVLFGHSFHGVAVKLNHLNFINHPNNHELWEVWDLRGSSVEILQRVLHWKKCLML